jgi:hypothetical protein
MMSFSKYYGSRNKNLFIFSLFLSGMLIVSGCNSSSGESAAVAANGTSNNAAASPVTNTGSTSPIVTPTPSPTNGTTTPAVGASCTGDSSKTCLSVHFVTYKDTNNVPTATTDQAATILQGMNRLYTQCGVAFQIDNYEAVDPTQSGLVYGAQSQNQLDKIRQTYQNPKNELLAVTTGPWGTAVNAWTNMPGQDLYGAIMEASIVTYGDGIIYAHEFGHYLGLDHVSDTSNLMNPVIYTSSTNLTSAQCQTVKDTINSYWTAMVRK